MIKPIQFSSNSPFSAFDTNKTNIKAPEPTVLNKTAEDTVQVANAQTEAAPKEKLTYETAKKKVFNVVKGFNTATGTTAGAIKGGIFGGLTLGAVGIIGKNIKEAKSNIWQSFGGIVKDTGKVLAKAFGFIPSIITKSPLQNVKSLTSLPSKFYGKYLKGHKATAAIATVAGLAVLGFNVVKGKVKANRKNADVDHSVNQGHIK
ncbi:MAG: hypothetical protein IJD57_08265 [Candidatus Gastranaerophilales bacterium]|nr:hypothetical protein [Candidatus Gastranaerophilales bacterium]